MQTFAEGWLRVGIPTSVAGGIYIFFQLSKRQET